MCVQGENEEGMHVEASGNNEETNGGRKRQTEEGRTKRNQDEGRIQSSIELKKRVTDQCA